MILVDTSVWRYHLKNGDKHLVKLLENGSVATHNLIIGELQVGSIKHRENFLHYLNLLPRVTEPLFSEISTLIEKERLYSKGLSWIDINLLLSSILGGIQFWTRDSKLNQVSKYFGINFN